MSETSLSVASRTVEEKTTFKYTATLKDEDGVVIPAADLDTLTLTLYDKAAGTIINSQNDTNVLNANNGTVHATSGLFTMLFKPADNPMVGTPDDDITEEHVVLFEWTYNSTTDAGKHQFSIYVVQRLKVT